MAARHKIGIFKWAWRALSEYLYPPYCISCKDPEPIVGNTADIIMRADPDSFRRGCFCGECLSDFISSCRRKCPLCGESYIACECPSDYLSANGVGRVYSCFCYDKTKRKSASSSLIYSVKNGENRDAVNFAAHLLAGRIEKAILTEWGSESDFILTFAPRRRGAVRQTGADHMKVTAELTAKLLGVRCKSLFVNTAQKAQKTRDAASRIDAATRYIRPKRGFEAAIAGRKIVLVDDIMTSGATLAASAAMLYEAGAASVIIVVLAKSVSEKNR